MASSEFELKISTINYIVRRYRLLDDTILIHEFSNGKCGARADIALRSNNLLYAFEVKSARDSLRRIGKQIEIYKKYFDHVVIIVDETHVNNAIEICKSSNTTLLRYKNNRITAVVKGDSKRISNEFIKQNMIPPKLSNENKNKPARDVLNNIITNKYHKNLDLTQRIFEKREIEHEDLLLLNPHFVVRAEKRRLSELRANKWSLFAEDITSRQTNHPRSAY
ncbi:sce7726 family protein [Agrobacterium rhizogenes]|uniref:sce7726 family protein n=1 Tax=Rhizobium rhizogenes TaxID=359 RepID=UPI001572217F|nr:sce7726 family protein [Rhizobium rhizogenes]NTF87461.1 sce7726 family protein [Rhizobium rhizogenes]